MTVAAVCGGGGSSGGGGMAAHGGRGNDFVGAGAAPTPTAAAVSPQADGSGVPGNAAADENAGVRGGLGGGGSDGGNASAVPSVAAHSGAVVDPLPDAAARGRALRGTNHTRGSDGGGGGRRNIEPVCTSRTMGNADSGRVDGAGGTVKAALPPGPLPTPDVSAAAATMAVVVAAAVQLPPTPPSPRREDPRRQQGDPP